MADRLPSLRGIEAFACVSEVLNLRVASERLNITVSAVSHRIQGLESELGVKLFDRGPGGLTLTREGRGFRQRLLPGLQALQEATRSAQPIAQKRVLRLSAPPIFYDRWLLPRLGHFLRSWPDTRIELLSSGRKRAAGTDIVIAPLTSATIRAGATALFEVRVTPMCSPGFAARHPITAPEALLDLPLIDFTPTSQSWSVWFAAAGIGGEAPAASILVDNQILVCEVLIQGLGVALGSPQLFAAMIEDGLAICPFGLEVTIPPTLGITIRNDEKMTRAFADWLIAEAAESFGVMAG